jgi:protoporphyrinogen IX oxidase
MLYLKAFHLLAIISWMAGIFYLPRIFVHYVEGRAAGEDVRRLKVMARRLYHFTSIMAVFSLVTGISLWLVFWSGTSAWIDAKLAMVALLVVYHLTMRLYMKRMQRDGVMPSSTALRWYNELPLLILLPILYFVVVKPF